MAVANTLPFSPDLVFGPFVIGFNAASILFGVLTVQYYLYHVNFPKDSSWIKCLALLVWLFELGHQVSISHSAYVIMISNYGSLRALFSCPKSIQSLSIFACSVSFTVRGFYIYRLWRFRRSWFLDLWNQTSSYTAKNIGHSLSLPVFYPHVLMSQSLSACAWFCSSGNNRTESNQHGVLLIS
ncbi:hypothetical protein DL96DRAFT_602126 [Flagelloscypha sp. PMI_526]|nr:hypothetical protein DL96DRAFT_602126 [Flagelloscypha sp. PMI_526]